MALKYWDTENNQTIDSLGPYIIPIETYPIIPIETMALFGSVSKKEKKTPSLPMD